MDRKKPTILIVEDDADMRETLHDSLSSDYMILIAASAREGLRMAEGHEPSLIISDVQMPGGTGIEFCAQLRANSIFDQVPLIIMTGYDSEESRVMAYDTGADDYIVKPFSPRELRARIESKLRKQKRDSGSSNSKAMEYLDIKILPDQNAVQIAGKSVSLGKIEYRVLSCLVQNSEQLVTRANLENFVWGDSQPQTRSLDVHVSLVRKKISQSVAQLRTVYSQGFVLERK